MDEHLTTHCNFGPTALLIEDISEIMRDDEEQSRPNRAQRRAASRKERRAGK